ncbi:MAG: DUF5913 domain-containing protein, partial [Brachybacterium sp.]|nr:DUF5913 domain-containing protein [Brachybacterium sp.]
MRRLLTHDTLATAADDLNLPSVDALYTSIGEGHTGAQHVVEKLRASFGGSVGAEEDVAEITMPSRVRSRAGREERRASETDQGVIVDGHADLWVKLAKCCAPVPGDPIVGFITRGSGISVHHETCTNAIQLQDQQPDRMVDLDVAAADESPQQGRGHRCRAEPEQVHGRAHRDGDGGAADRLDLIGSQPRGAQHDAGDLAPMG